MDNFGKSVWNLLIGENGPITQESNQNSEGGNKVEPPIPGATGGERYGNGPRIWDKPGTAEDANRDFDDKNPTNVDDKGNGVRVGELPNGDRIVVRPGSSEGSGNRPTIEIQTPNGKKPRDKIRYTCP
jgi:hypothetical protein